MKLAGLIALILLLILALSCAKQTVPTGGPKDTIPPSLVLSVPIKEQINYKENTITLTFDEYVTLDNPREQVIITPSLGKNLEMNVKKKTVTLKLPSTPKDSTTYTINFRESIKDITEGTPAQDLKLAFSTGPYIDSLSIRGIVFDPLKGNALKNITVALYHNPDTFNIFDHSPQYFTKANDEGIFLLENLKADNYFIYAFDDKNKNLKVDSKTEVYGFLKDTIRLQPGYNVPLEIPLVKLDARPLKLISARPVNTYFSIKMAKGLASYSLTPLEKQDSIVTIFAGPDQTTINAYLVQLSQDSIQAHFLAEDSISFNIDTVLYVKKPTRKANPEDFTLKLEKPIIYSNNARLDISMIFNKPVKAINFDSITYKLDSANTVTFNPDDVTINSVNSLTLTKPIDKNLLFPAQDESFISAPRDLKTEGTSAKDKDLINQLYFGHGAFISIEDDSSKQTSQQATFLREEETGIIFVNINTDAENFIVQLLDKNFQTIKTVYNIDNITFNNLNPGEYQIRLIIDRNANRRWDPGNYYKKIEPEEILFYRSEEGLQSVNIKANWELGPLLISSKQNVDNQVSSP